LIKKFKLYLKMSKNLINLRKSIRKDRN
jgi:hypothetical protein